MRSLPVVAVLVLLLVLLPSVAAAAPPGTVHPGAAPDPTEVQTLAPSPLLPGVSTYLQATLRDAASNAPLAGENLSFAERTTFGWLPLGTSATNDQGEAGVAYEPAAGGTYTVLVSFAGDASHAPSNATISVSVLAAPSPPSPLLPTDTVIALIIVAVVGGVWTTYAFVGWQVLGIRAAGGRSEEEEEAEEEVRNSMEKEDSEAEKPAKRVPGAPNASHAVLVLAIAALLLGAGAFAFAAIGGVGHTAATYTPTTVALQVTVVPDFRGTGWDSYVPDELVVHAGDTVKITVYNEDTMAHGFAIDALAVNNQLAPATADAGGNITPSVTVITFTVPNAGLFTWYCTDPCGPGHTTMTGTLAVLPDD